MHNKFQNVGNYTENPKTKNYLFVISTIKCSRYIFHKVKLTFLDSL